MNQSKDHPFLRGMLLLFPFVITAAVILIIFHLLTTPIYLFLNPLLSPYLGESSAFFIIPLLSLALFFSSIVLLGYLANWYFVRQIINWLQHLFRKLPIINSVYIATDEIMQTIFVQNKHGFPKLVFVPYPTQKALTLGIIIKKTSIQVKETTYVGVLVPGLPIPLGGYYIFYPEKDLQVTSFSLEDAIKWIFSLGIIGPKKI